MRLENILFGVLLVVSCWGSVWGGLHFSLPFLIISTTPGVVLWLCNLVMHDSRYSGLSRLVFTSIFVLVPLSTIIAWTTLIISMFGVLRR